MPVSEPFSIEYLSISLFVEKISVNEVYHIDLLSILLRKGVIFFFKRQKKTVSIFTCVDLCFFFHWTSNIHLCLEV